MDNPVEDKKINWRQFGRHWIVVFVLAIAAGFVIYGMLHVSTILQKVNDWQDQRLARKIQDMIEGNDKYGGQTPEETLDMFLVALDKGDTELASKYFEVRSQSGWRASLEAIKGKPKAYEQMLAELKYARLNSSKAIQADAATFSYMMPGRDSGSEISFERRASRWKIFNF
jgi:hypothetical protein